MDPGEVSVMAARLIDAVLVRVRWSEHPEVGALALGAAVTALVCVGSVIAPFSPTAPRTMTLVNAVIALAILGALLGRVEHVRPVHLHAIVALSTGLLTLHVASTTTPAGTVVTAVDFFWITVYCALFFTQRALVAHLSLIGLGMAVALGAAGAVSPVHTWVLLMLMNAGVAYVLSALVAALRQHATRDPLTGVLNRRAFADEARREIARASRASKPIVLVLIDFDDFKGINDSMGHAAGDAVLGSATTAWQGCLRPHDRLGRLGGDEFLVMLPGADAAQAQQVLRRLADASDHSWTAGVAQWEGDRFDDWLRRADDALYRAKGRPGARGVVSRP